MTLNLASPRSVALALGIVTLASCAQSPSSGGAAAPAPAMAPAARWMAPPSPDPRVGLRAGATDAATASWNMKLLSNTLEPEPFAQATHSDLAFRGNYVIQGNYAGPLIWDVTNPAAPVLKTAFPCPASQNDVSVYGNLLFLSAEGLNGRVDCGGEGVKDTVSQERMRGVRIFDISDIEHPALLASVQTCRGSHTHTVLVDPNDKANVYVYVSGQAGVRSPNELAGCSNKSPEEDPNSAHFRIEVIKVPLAHPEQAAIVSSPRIFDNLEAPPTHGQAPADMAAMEKERARGAFIVKVGSQEFPLPDRFAMTLLDSVVKARNGTGAPTSADSAALRAGLPALIARLTGGSSNRPPTGPDQCHDITVYPAIGLAGGACAGYGFLLDISNPASPRRIAAVADSNFSYWHSATFNNDGTKVLFSDEWGGGGQPKCRATDPREWGADAIFSITSDRKLKFESYYKLPAAQTEFENCVAHNGSLIPVPGRDIMVQAWYQGGVSVFDWTDAAHPREIAFFDRGPVDSTRMAGGGAWSTYWYNGYIYSSEISRGFDVFALTPNPMLTQNELDAARSATLAYLNVQDQPKYTWPANFAVPRAYLDQLTRGNGLAAEKIVAARTALDQAEKLSGQARKEALTRLGAQLHADARGAADEARVHKLASSVDKLAG
ncbi:MAG: LVIVD repeat-containing protein, partial [Gemmatimonadales bacterium]